MMPQLCKQMEPLMDAPTMINELAQRILRDEHVSDEELAEAVQAMRSARIGATDRAKKKVEAETVDLDALFSSLPNKEKADG